MGGRKAWFQGPTHQRDGIEVIQVLSLILDKFFRLYLEKERGEGF